MIEKIDIVSVLIKIFKDIGIYLDKDNLTETIEMDSLQFVCLIIGIESEFGIEVGDDFYKFTNRIVTLETYTDYIYNKVR